MYYSVSENTIKYCRSFPTINHLCPTICLTFPQNFTTRQKCLVEMIVKYHNSLVHPNKELCQRNLTLVDTFRIHFCSSRPVELKLNLPLEHSAPFNSITQYFLCDRKKVTEKEYVYTYPMYNKEISNHDGLKKNQLFHAEKVNKSNGA